MRKFSTALSYESDDFVDRSGPSNIWADQFDFGGSSNLFDSTASGALNSFGSSGSTAGRLVTFEQSSTTDGLIANSMIGESRGSFDLAGKPDAGDFVVYPEWELAYLKGGSPVSAPSTISPTNAPATISGAIPGDIALDSSIDVPGEFDVFSINLTAGETYLFSVYGSGANPLADTVLYIADDTFTIVGSDDDGGSGVNSLLTYTAGYTGTHYIGIEGYPGAGLTGDYTLDVVLDPGVDVVGDTFGGAPMLTIGEVAYGFIEPGPGVVYGAGFSEVDTYAFTVEAGNIYSFEIAGGADYASDWFDLPPGELDTYAVILDSLGNIVALNDDISFPNDVSSRVTFFAEEDGTYYLDVFSYQPWTGGFSITSSAIDPTSFDPLDALYWESADNVTFDASNTAYVYFGDSDENFNQTGDFGGPMITIDWNDYEKGQVMEALEQYEKILGVNYEITTDVNEATFRLLKTESQQYGAYFFPQDPGFGADQGVGVFNVLSGAWSFDQQQSLEQGGFSFAVIMHEFGHAHGLAHPHDTGGGSEVLLGVTGAQGSFGIYDLNQGVYTVMSYNDAWQNHPDGPTPFSVDNIDSGWSGTLGAFDIAALQNRYGVINPYAQGNTVYELGDNNDPGVYYETIWDTGGWDTIEYNGARDARIDLMAATIDYTPTGGGVVSFVDDVFGGYTIANGVVIEQGEGGSGNDIILGNEANNHLYGNDGDDFLMGRGGGDRIDGGRGIDTVSYMDSASGVSVSIGNGGAGLGFGGDAAGDYITDVEILQGSHHDDVLVGGTKTIRIEGLGGDDYIDGGNGDDDIDGGDGDDTIDGSNGKDILNGGAGNDIYTGGNGKDVFVFSEIGGFDTITDFKRKNDSIDISEIDAIDGGADDAFNWIGSSGFSGTAGELRSYGSFGDYFVEGDTNGDGIADFTIQTNILIQQGDFLSM